MRKLSHWLEELTPTESIDLYREQAISHAREGGACGARIVDLIVRGDLRALCEFEIDYDLIQATALEQTQELSLSWDDILELEGEDAIDELFEKTANIRAAAIARSCRQALAFFQKVEGLEIGIDKEEVAFKKFLEAEELCRETNDIFRKVHAGELSIAPRVSSVLYAAQRKIARILGDTPDLGELDLRFGPGATRGTKRKDASSRRKLAEKLQCSEDLLPTVVKLLEEMPHLTSIHSLVNRVDEDGEEWDRVELEVIPAKLSFVPKSAKTYRSICTEPGLNTVVQAGLGTYMARRLAAFGIDIRDQTVNQRRAKEGSLTGALATLDLSSASDTISQGIVFELLPFDWALLLDGARSSHVLLPTGEVIGQEKFSSMGNGFTFPLETLIFWSLAASCCSQDSDATVYGDDIVVPTASYDLLVEVLQTCGFVVNEQKSYCKGLFRESCGRDYYWGIDVRPYYPKGWVTGQSLFVLHNFYVRRGDLVRAKLVESYIHPSLRLFGPDGFGDGHLLGQHPRRRPAKYDLRGYSGYFFDTFVTGNPRDKIPLSRGEWVVPLYAIYRRSSEQWFTPSTDTTKVVRGPLEIACFWGKLHNRGIGEGGPAPLALPEGSDEAKHLSLPGVTGYKKVQIYTLGD